MKRLVVFWYAACAGFAVASLVLAVTRRDVGEALAWFVVLLWIANAALSYRDFTASRAESAHLRACLTYTREERDDARAQLRRAHMRLRSRGDEWADTRVNGGRPLPEEVQ